jgi:hypothetical protein
MARQLTMGIETLHVKKNQPPWIDPETRAGPSHLMVMPA